MNNTFTVYPTTIILLFVSLVKMQLEFATQLKAQDQHCKVVCFS